MNWWPDGDSNAARLPLSALEQYAYCPRQAALIHVDGVFTDDVNTVRGYIAHQWVDKPRYPDNRHHRHAPATPGAHLERHILRQRRRVRPTEQHGRCTVREDLNWFNFATVTVQAG